VAGSVLIVPRLKKFWININCSSLAELKAATAWNSNVTDHPVEDFGLLTIEKVNVDSPSANPLI
jgi:hypothetical protein